MSTHQFKQRSPLFLLLLLFCTSCAGFIAAFAPKQSDNPLEVLRQINLNKPRCKDTSYYFSTNATLAVNVLASICSRGRTDRRSHRDMLDQLKSDDALSPLAAALMITLCVDSGYCEESPRSGRERYSDGALGTMLYYVERTKVPAVEAQLVALELNAEATKVFMQRFIASKQHILSVHASRPDEIRAVYFTPIAAARERWYREAELLGPFDKQYEQLSRRFDKAFLAKQVPGTLITSAQKLRLAYVKGCIKLDRSAYHCLGRPVSRWLTERLLQAHFAREDMLGVVAENALLEGIPSRSRLNYQLNHAVETAMKKEAGRYAEYLTAKQAGVSSTLLAQRFSPLPLAPRQRSWNLAGTTAPTKALNIHYRITKVPYSQKPLYMEDVIAKVVRHGSRATLHFSPKIWTSDIGVGCKETGKVDFIDRSGRVVYRQNCKSWKTKTTVKKKPIITIPSGEAKKIGKGDIVVLRYNHKFQGRIITVYRAGKNRKRSVQKQIGAFPLG